MKYLYLPKLLLILFSFFHFLDANEFFRSGALADLIPFSEKKPLITGKITVLTEPIHENARQTIQGHNGVTGSVLRGLQKLGIPMSYNPTKPEDVGEHIIVLVSIEALYQAIDLKKQGRIKTLIVGPNIMNNPSENNHLLGSAEIDCYIAPCNWARTCNIEEEPLIKRKTAIWYAGVDTNFWQPITSKTESKTMLVYWKTEPESFCIAIEEILRAHGWQTIRLHYGHYDTKEYKNILNQVDAATFISVSESQGIALAECWAMNIPTLVWAPGTAFIYNRWIPVSSAPYLTQATGVFWQTVNDLNAILISYNELKRRFAPRNWVLNYMTDESSIMLMLDIIQSH